MLDRIDPTFFRINTLYLGITRQGTLFVWKVPLPVSDMRVNSWHSSLREAAEYAMTHWVRVYSVTEAKSYRYGDPVVTYPEPTWPELSFQEILRLAFKGLVIDRPDHEVLKRLRGEI